MKHGTLSSSLGERERKKERKLFGSSDGGLLLRWVISHGGMRHKSKSQVLGQRERSSNIFWDFLFIESTVLVGRVQNSHTVLKT